ncbi:MAG: Ig-like domain-containing protein, partial [Polyangiales bacterium]
MRVRLGRWAYRVCWAWLCLAAVVAAAPQRAEAQACPSGKFCFYVPPGLPFEGSHSGMTTRTFDIVLSAPVKMVTGTYAIAGDASQRFTVSPGTSFRIALPGASGHASAYGAVEPRGVFLVADSPDLTVDHREVFDSEQYSETIKRHSIALGTRFRLAGYALNGEGRPNAGIDAVLIYAPTGASVTLRAPPGATLPFWSSTTQADLTVTLTAGQTVALRTLVARDLDGALLTATQPVAVSSGGRGWSVANCGDDGMDGLVPVSALGTEYALRLPTGSASQESRVRVIADEADTVVRVNGTQVATLAAGAYYSFQPTALSYVQTSRPALVWMNGSLSGCELETALIPPIAFAPALTSLSLDFNVLASNQTPPAELAILIATRDVASIRVDGSAPRATSSMTVPSRPELTYVRFAVSSGDRNVRADSDFQAMLASRTAPSGLLAYYNPFRIPGCGDSGADPGEGCDDGDVDDGDGCSSTCQIEPGFVCDQTPSMCRTICGDSQVGAPVESCDDGNAVGGDGCNTTCRPELTVTAPADASATTDATPTFRGTADPRAMVRIAIGAQEGTVAADDEGTWTYTPTAPITDGMRTVTITATDARGGTSTAMRTLTIDTSTVLTLDAPRPGAATRDTTPTFSGTGELGSLVEVRVDDVSVGTTMVGGDRTWTLTPTTPLTPGAKQAIATATDALSNTISTTPVGFTIDDRTTVTIAAPAASEVLTSALVRAHGTGEAGATVALAVRDAGGAMVNASATVTIDGQWMVDLPTPLANGAATATATATDVLGNTATAEVAFRVDASTRVAVEAPLEDALVRTVTPELRGTGEPGARV